MRWARSETCKTKHISNIKCRRASEPRSSDGMNEERDWMTIERKIESSYTPKRHDISNRSIDKVSTLIGCNGQKLWSSASITDDEQTLDWSILYESMDWLIDLIDRTSTQRSCSQDWLSDWLVDNDWLIDCQCFACIIFFDPMCTSRNKFATRDKELNNQSSKHSRTIKQAIQHSKQTTDVVSSDSIWSLDESKHEEICAQSDSPKEACGVDINPTKWMRWKRKWIEQRDDGSISTYNNCGHQLMSQWSNVRNVWLIDWLGECWPYKYASLGLPSNTNKRLLEVRQRNTHRHENVNTINQSIDCHSTLIERSIDW